MTEPDQDLQATRWMTRLKNWDDQEGWREFFDLYWRLSTTCSRVSAT